MAGGMCARGHAWQGACMVGVCVAGEMATAGDSMHPTGIHCYTLLYFQYCKNTIKAKVP